MTTRRDFVAGAGALAGWGLAGAGVACAAGGLPGTLTADLARLELENGGRLGVAVQDTGSGATSRPSRRRTLSDVQHLQAPGRRGRAQTRRRRPGEARPAHRVSVKRHRRQLARHQGARRRRRHDARRTVRGRDDRQRQHRRQSDPGKPRRSAGHHRLCALARRHGHPPRPHRAGSERGRAGRSARYDNAAGHAGQCAESWCSAMPCPRLRSSN